MALEKVSLGTKNTKNLLVHPKIDSHFLPICGLLLNDKSKRKSEVQVSEKTRHHTLQKIYVVAYYYFQTLCRTCTVIPSTALDLYVKSLARRRLLGAPVQSTNSTCCFMHR